MFYFLCRLSLKMVMEWKREILLVMAGMVICFCAVIKFTDNTASFKRFYWDVKGIKEEQIFYENRVHFCFKDTEKLPAVVEQLKNQEGINNVILKGNLEILTGKNFPVASYSASPVFSVHDNSIGKVPEHMEDGTIVLSFTTLADLDGMSSNARVSDEDIELYDEEIEESKYKVFYSCDQMFPIGNKRYEIVAENFNFMENLLSQNDFMELHKSEKLTDLEIIYIYDEGFSDGQKKQAENLVRSIKTWEKTYEEQVDNTLEISDYLDAMGALLIGMVFAVLNALFIYQSVLKRRMPSYSILKILGLKNFMLRLMVLCEMLLIFIVSYCIAGVMFFTYSCLTGELLYNLQYSLGYSFALLLVIYTLISIVMTKKLMKSQPFEAYSMGK